MRKDAASDAKLTRDVVRNFAVSLVHHKNFTRSWSSEGTGSRKFGTTWFPTGVVAAFASSSDVSKLSKKERINVGYFASSSRGGPAGVGRLAFEVMEGAGLGSSHAGWRRWRARVVVWVRRQRLWRHLGWATVANCGG